MCCGIRLHAHHSDNVVVYCPRRLKVVGSIDAYYDLARHRLNLFIQRHQPIRPQITRQFRRAFIPIESGSLVETRLPVFPDELC